MLENEQSVADFVRTRIERDPKVRAIVGDARMFDELREQPGWKRLYEKVKSDKERFMAGLARRLMGGEEIDPKEVVFMRGFYRGAVWVLSHPEYAEDNLERAARMAYTLAMVEIDEQEEEASLYA